MSTDSKTPMYALPALAKVVGAGPFLHAEASKRVWKYIRSHHLQDSREKRNINVDGVLSDLFHGKSLVSIFDVARCIREQLSAHPMRAAPQPVTAEWPAQSTHVGMRVWIVPLRPPEAPKIGREPVQRDDLIKCEHCECRLNPKNAAKHKQRCVGLRRQRVAARPAVAVAQPRSVPQKTQYLAKLLQRYPMPKPRPAASSAATSGSRRPPVSFSEATHGARPPPARTRKCRYCSARAMDGGDCCYQHNPE
jgi:hypothetical protein